MMMMFVCAKKTKLKNFTSFRIYVRDSPIITGVNWFVVYYCFFVKQSLVNFCPY